MTITSETIQSLDASTAQFIKKTVDAIVYAYRLQLCEPWLRALGDGDEDSPQDILENWVCRYIRWVPEHLSEPMFQMLHGEFEKIYYSQGVVYESTI